MSNTTYSVIERLVEDVRLMMNDPAITSRFTDTQIVGFAAKAMRDVFTDIQRIDSSPIVLSMDIGLNPESFAETEDGRNEYVAELPPAIGEIVRMGTWDSGQGRFESILDWGTMWKRNAEQERLYLDGHRLVSHWKLNEPTTVKIEYIPSGEYSPVLWRNTYSSGNLFSTSSADYVVLPPDSKIIAGQVDPRPNAYCGSILRIWNESKTSPMATEKTVTAYFLSLGNRVVTISPNFGGEFDSYLKPSPWSTDVVGFELVPPLSALGFDAVAMRTARFLAAMSGDASRDANLMMEYRALLRGARLAKAFFNVQEIRWGRDSPAGVSRDLV